MQICLPTGQCVPFLHSPAEVVSAAEPCRLLCKNECVGVCGRSNAPCTHPAAPARLLSSVILLSSSSNSHGRYAARHRPPLRPDPTDRCAEARSTRSAPNASAAGCACPPAAIARCPGCRLVHAHARIVPTLAYLLCPFPPLSAAALQAAARPRQRPLLCKPPPGLVHAHMLGLHPHCPTCCALPSPDRCRSHHCLASSCSRQPRRLGLVHGITIPLTCTSWLLMLLAPLTSSLTEAAALAHNHAWPARRKCHLQS